MTKSGLNSSKRVKPASDVTTNVLVRSRRRCAFCYGMHGDLEEKEGQIAHIDRKNTNSRETNLAWLCLNHHNRYDTKPSQAKGYSIQELRQYRKELYKFISDTPPHLWGANDQLNKAVGKRKPTPVTMELYLRRLGIYKLAQEFISEVVGKADPKIPDAIAFVRAVDESRFLFNSEFYEYLESIYKKAVRMHYLNVKIHQTKDDGHIQEYVKEESAALLWFTQQFDILEKQAFPFLSWG